MALCGLCEVLFHVDEGNRVEHVCPPGAFSEEECADIAFSAFPDSLSMELTSRSSVRDSSFCFRLRRRGALPGGRPAPHPWLHGHVFCRQRQDERLRRGCEQKSIVLLSHLPLMGLLEPLARLVGPAALSYGPDLLREVLREVQGWPPLEWGRRADLPLLGVDGISLALPPLTSLPSSALPAAVAASLDLPQQQPQGEGQQQQQQQQQLDLPHGVAAAAEQGVEPAEGQAVAEAEAASHPESASPAQVAAALADELDGSGLPLCLLPQAYGQQELEASPFGDCDCYTPLRGVLSHLWTLWELLLLGEPLMVLAPTPGACSSAVTALLSLLAPLPYSLDWRPYFTIHDAAFARLAAGEAPAAGNGLPMVLGTTNLYFLKALPDWGNVLSTGYTAATLAPSSSSDRLDEAASANGGSGNGSSSGGLQPSESALSMASSGGGGGPGALGPKQSSSSWLGGTLRRTPASPAALLSGPVDHCWLQYKPCSRPDKQVLERLVQPAPSDSADRWRRLAAVNSGMLRRHFQELTKALLFPLLPYFSPCPPPTAASAAQSADPRAAEAAGTPPPLPSLDVEALLEQLASRDAILPEVLLQRFGGQKGLLHFYERFLRSPNLAAFLAARRLAAEEWQRQEWADAADAAAAPMRELLHVERFFWLEQQLSAARVQLATAAAGDEGGEGGEGEGAAAAAALADSLQQQLRLAFHHLPEDLQQAILQTPSHAQLLGNGGGGGGRRDSSAEPSPVG